MILTLHVVLFPIEYCMFFQREFHILFLYKKIDSGSAIIATYVLYAIFSIMVIQDPIFGALYKPLEIFPYLYLYVMILISISPIIYHHLHPTQEITDSQTRLWVIMGWIIVVCSLCLYLKFLEVEGDSLFIYLLVFLSVYGYVL